MVRQSVDANGSSPQRHKFGVISKWNVPIILCSNVNITGTFVLPGNMHASQKFILSHSA